MTALILPNGKQQFIDINGKPLVGGTVGMYIPGTLIFSTTWQDAAQTILNTNPIILDSRGQALIYGNATYRQIVKDSLGNLIWDQLVYGQVGSGPVDIRSFGAVGDGTTDNTAAINRALSSGGQLLIPQNNVFLFSGALNSNVAGTQLIGQGITSVLLPVSLSRAAQVNVNANGFVAQNFTYGSASNLSTEGQGFVLGQSGMVTGTLIEDINFLGNTGLIEFAVSLCNCIKTWVNRCSFTSITYSIIQQPNTSVDSLKVTDCYCSDAYADFIEINATGTGGAADILIEGNTFLGAHGFPIGATEKRFVGLVNAVDVRIVNNYVQDVCGDAVIHAEASSGRLTITGNSFIDCVPTGGNNGYIYLLASTATSLIDDNWFICTQPATGGVAISTSSGSYTLVLTFSNNHCIDLSSGGGNFGMVDLSGAGAAAEPIAILGNTLQNGSALAILYNTFNVLFDANTVIGVNGIIGANIGTPNGRSGTDIDVKNNRFNVISYALHADKNTNGTDPPVNWTFTGNKVSAGNVDISNGVDCMGGLNWYGSTCTDHSVGNDKNDWLQGTGWIHP